MSTVQFMIFLKLLILFYEYKPNFFIIIWALRFLGKTWPSREHWNEKSLWDFLRILRLACRVSSSASSLKTYHWSYRGFWDKRKWDVWRKKTTFVSYFIMSDLCTRTCTLTRMISDHSKFCTSNVINCIKYTSTVQVKCSRYLQL